MALGSVESALSEVVDSSAPAGGNTAKLKSLRAANPADAQAVGALAALPTGATGATPLWIEMETHDGVRGWLVLYL